jgi:acetyl-CoA carboxylase biotin carboxyl carrier protein
MEEFGLSEAKLTVGEFSVGFKKRSSAPRSQVTEDALMDSIEAAFDAFPQPRSQPEQPRGTPVTSPMTGIYYNAPSPSSPPFVKEGDTVTAGQIIGLIEAMKVFNEVPATASGTVLKAVAATGQLVSPGDVLILVG